MKSCFLLFVLDDSMLWLFLINISGILALQFQYLALQHLRVDQNLLNFQPRIIKNATFVISKPSVFNFLTKPQVVATSKLATQLLPEDLAKIYLSADSPKNIQKILGHKKFTPQQKFYSHNYYGYQFGTFSGQLGDGTNVYFGEVLAPNSSGQNSIFAKNELQIKGAGITAFSRKGDGLKVLRSSLREFLCSEFLFAIGLPTTRAVNLITDLDSKIQRYDQSRRYYKNGHTVAASNRVNPRDWLQNEPIAVVTRLAPSFLRFGSFEMIKSWGSEATVNAGNFPLLDNLVNFTISTYFSGQFEYQGYFYISNPNLYQGFLDQVATLSANLLASWMAIGFCHGVLNTDNMSILGLSIDLGPFQMMDYFDPDFVCNLSDEYGRYSFSHQPEIFKWNLSKLMEALNQNRDQVLKFGPVILDEKLFDQIYTQKYASLMAEKFGIQVPENVASEIYLRDFLAKFKYVATQTRPDYFKIFQILENFSQSPENLHEFAVRIAQICQTPKSLKNQMQVIYDNELLMSVYKKYRKILDQNQAEQFSLKNPKQIVLDLVGELEAENVYVQLIRIDRLKKLTSLRPDEKFSQDLKLWKQFLASYRNFKVSPDFFKNPKFSLKNHILQDLIQKTENGDFTAVQNLVDKFDQIYDPKNFENFKFLLPEWAETYSVSCSS